MTQINLFGNFQVTLHHFTQLRYDLQLQTASFQLEAMHYNQIFFEKKKPSATRKYFIC